MHVGSRSFNVLSLCSGGGGLDLGVQLAVPAACTVAYVEIEAYACEILATRMQEDGLDAAPIWSDLQTFDGRPWRRCVDLLIGGYPCQPFSVAGQPVRRQLNPTFVEWLMGWPRNFTVWTDCGSSVTGWSHYKQRIHYALSRMLLEKDNG